MRACCYVRVSSNQQTTDNQLPAIETYAKSHGHELTSYYAENE